jgi:WD40 repeat protein
MGATATKITEMLPDSVVEKVRSPLKWKGFQEQQIRTFFPAHRITCALAVGGDSDVVLLGDAEGYGIFYDISRRREEDAKIAARAWHKDQITGMCFLPGLPLLAQADAHYAKENTFAQVSALIARKLPPVSEGARRIRYKALQAEAFKKMQAPLPCSGALATSSMDSTIKVWNLDRGLCLTSLPTEQPLNCIMLHPNAALLIGGSAVSADIFAYNIMKQECYARLVGHVGVGPVMQLHYVDEFGMLSSCGGTDTRILVWPEREEWTKVKRFNAKAGNAPPPYFTNPRMELRRPSDDDWKRALGAEAQPGRAPQRHGLDIYVDKCERVPKADAWIAGGQSDPYLRFRCVEVDGPSAENGWGKDSVFLRPEVPKGWCSECRTEVVWMNLNPVYQETLDLDLTGGPNEDSCKVFVELWDRDLSSADDLLGVVELDYAEIKNGDHAYVTSYQVNPAPDSMNDYNLDDCAIYMSLKYVVRPSARPEPPPVTSTKGKENVGSCTCTYDYHVKRPEGEEDDWLVAAGYTDGRLYVWDLKSPTPVEINRGWPMVRIQAHDSIADIKQIPASSDNRLAALATAGGDGVIKLWRPDTIEPLAVLHQFKGNVGFLLTTNSRLCSTIALPARGTNLLTVWA